MSRPHEPTSCQDFELRIEALVDGELEAAEKASLDEHLENCPACATQFHLALGIRRELRALPELDTPPHVLEAALKHSRRRESRRGSWARFWQAPRPAWLALGAATAAALLSILILAPEPETTEPEITAEVERATEEARLALAYIDKLTHRAARDLREDIVQRRVVEPAARGLTRSLRTQETESPTTGPVSDYRLSNDSTRSS
jgi:hypothetical protein